MTSYIHFRCPCCHGSQYRTSAFDVSEKNPYGTKCIFCKSPMVAQLNAAPVVFRDQSMLTSQR